LSVDCFGGWVSEAALRIGLCVLCCGDLLGIYLEGTRLLDGWLYCGKIGVVCMVFEGGVLVIFVCEVVWLL